MAYLNVHARVWIGSIGILAAGCGSHPLRLGETRQEYGAERACGARPHLDARVSSLAFERRMGGAHATAIDLTCAAHAARAPSPLPLAEPSSPSAARCEAESQCYDGFRATGDAQSDLGALAQRCGRACGMTPHTEMVQADAAQGDAHVFTLDLDAATCYRVFAVGARDIDVLAAAITDASGNVVAIDNSRDRAPILGPRAAFCPSAGGRYRVVLEAVHGAGTYVLQAWSRPRLPSDR